MSFLVKMLLTGFLTFSWGTGSPVVQGMAYGGLLFVPPSIDLNAAASDLMVDALQFRAPRYVGISIRQRGKTWYPTVYAKLGFRIGP